jgi:adenosylcobinamide-GDP ribazoletransferase
MQIAAVSVLAPIAWAWPMLVATPALGRVSLVFAAWLGVPARPGGLGARIMGRPGIGSVAVASLGTIAIVAGLYAAGGTLQLAWGVAGVIIAAAVPHLIAQRMGGATGDVMGASVLVTEAIVLVVASLLVAW